jgi:hypothetical protein
MIVRTHTAVFFGSLAAAVLLAGCDSPEPLNAPMKVPLRDGNGYPR